ncbi:MAG: hypothetical protein WDA75_21785 [Candidatus Latescibacterota bacterium]|jgi:hypothetical protein
MIQIDGTGAGGKDATTPAPSCLNLAADLVGCVVAPGGLSHEARYLKGLGR